jgi:hypothetical protein
MSPPDSSNGQPRCRLVEPSSHLLQTCNLCHITLPRGNQCCGSGMFIPDPKNSNKREGEQKFLVISFFVATNFTKLKNYFIFKMPKKKIWANFQRIIELFAQKFVTQLSKIWVWDLGSRSRGQKGTGSRIRIRNTGGNLGKRSTGSFGLL